MVLQLAAPLPRIVVELMEEEGTHDPPHVASTQWAVLTARAVRHILASLSGTLSGTKSQS
jgi:hypothetical protein